MTQRNSPERAAMLAKRAAEQRNRTGLRQYAPAKPRHGRRGEVGQSWRTKRWTRSRIVDFLQWKASRG